ncbi:MAG: membrane protein insertase YidC [Rhodospirillales bacterium]|nr:membrane protein insertase YidC [Rhodospirillales bacterium]MCB9997275.1 membrane protein insertase YidC [Rhodospirillales bacterium]
MMQQNNDQMHPDDLKNLILFIVLALGVWMVFDHFLLKPKVEALRTAQEQQQEAYRDAAQGGDEGQAQALRARAEVIAEGPRIKIETDKITGSIALTGARIDDVSLNDYFQTMEKIRNVNLMSPMGSFHPRYAAFGWADDAKKIKVPTKKTVWKLAEGSPDVLRPDQPVTLYWDNGQGLRFEREIGVDDNYLFTVKQRLVNTGDKYVSLFPYAIMVQHGLPEELYGRWIVHEGPIGYIDGELTELSYKKIKKEQYTENLGDKGWFGMTEHYWFTGMFPEHQKDNVFHFVYVTPEEAKHVLDRYQVDVMGPARTINAGETVEHVTRVYVGPKKLSILEDYEKQYGWDHIDLAVDFGMYYFMTKPLYKLLHWLGNMAGNFGIGIIMLTFIVRIFVFPLANTSYRSFAKLRKIGPQMSELREKYGDDKEKLQAGLVKLYEKEKVNPMAGCMPILIQIPIFFALFKVLQISIEMRHAPFYGWINDLSAPDPTSIFNLFGLIPWDPPQALMIGVWPCLMGFFMILQKKMSPPPQDKMQKTMMDIMPYFITYILSSFAAGLVIYWTFSNALSVLQQYIIMKSMGVEPELFKSKEQKEMDRKIAEGPAVHPELEVLEHEVEEALFGDDEKDKESKAVSKPKPKKSKKKK